MHTGQLGRRGNCFLRQNVRGTVVIPSGEGSASGGEGRNKKKKVDIRNDFKMTFRHFTASVLPVSTAAFR